MICIIGDESRIGFPIAAFFSPAFALSGNAPGGFGCFALAGAMRLRFFSPAFALSGNAPAAPAISPLRAQYACAARRISLRVNCVALSPFCAEAQCGLRTPALPPLRAQCACAARFRPHQCIKFAASRYFLSDSPIFDFNSYLSITALSNFEDSSSHVRHASARIFSSPEFMSRHVAQILAS